MRDGIVEVGIKYVDVVLHMQDMCAIATRNNYPHKFDLLFASLEGYDEL